MLSFFFRVILSLQIPARIEYVRRYEHERSF
nr:MAG TPA: hypothetical protein [Caudoviricetes sp.]